MTFRKYYEVFTPEDLCWIEVRHYPGSQIVELSSTKIDGDPIRICQGEGDHLDGLIAILQHLRERYPTSGDDEGVES